MSFSVRHEHRRSAKVDQECVVITLSPDKSLDVSSLLFATEEMLSTPTGVEILLTNGNITDTRLAELYAHLSRIPRTWRVRLVDLSNNQLTDASAPLIASLIRSSTPEELCLSGNKFTNFGALNLIEAIQASAAYPIISSETNQPVPMWLRLDRNDLDQVSFWASLSSPCPSLRVCGAEGDECSSAQCIKADTQLHLPDLQVQNTANQVEAALPVAISPILDGADLNDEPTIASQISESISSPRDLESSGFKSADELLKVLRDLYAADRGNVPAATSATQEHLRTLLADMRTGLLSQTQSVSQSSLGSTTSATASQVLQAVKNQETKQLSRDAPAFVPVLSAAASQVNQPAADGKHGTVAPEGTGSPPQKTTRMTVALMAVQLPGTQRMSCGLDMIPSREGYYVTNVGMYPGQANVQRGDRLIEINGRPLVKEEASKMREVFADELKDGVQMTILRPVQMPALDHTSVTRKINMNVVMEGAGIPWTWVLTNYRNVLYQYLLMIAKVGVTGAFDEDKAAVNLTGPRTLLDTAAAGLNEKLISLLNIAKQQQVI
jgi:hypothetical protein